MDVNIILDQLKFFKNDAFKFYEEEHTYFYGKKSLQSVTNFIQQFHVEFEKETLSQSVADKRGVSQLEILNEWQQANDVACSLGHKIHKYIEDYYTEGVTAEEDGDAAVKVRIECFLNDVVPRLKDLVPIAQEVRVFSERLKLAGTVDALFLRGDDLYMLDWKSSKKIETDKQSEILNYSKKMYPPFQDEWDNNMNHYSIQLSTYRLILAERGIKVKEGVIVHLPPSGTGATLYKTKDYTGLLSAYFGVDFSKIK